MQTDDELKSILWKCRRGTRELDLILENFVESHYQHLAEQDKAEFRRLLDYEEPLLIDWLCYQKKPEVREVEKIVARIWSVGCGQA